MDRFDEAQDLWRFSAGAWTRWTSSLGRPAARSGHVAIWDDVNDLLWIHGGAWANRRRYL